jgi:hypothetical protein
MPEYTYQFTARAKGIVKTNAKFEVEAEDKMKRISVDEIEWQEPERIDGYELIRTE